MVYTEETPALGTFHPAAGPSASPPTRPLPPHSLNVTTHRSVRYVPCARRHHVNNGEFRPGHAHGEHATLGLVSGGPRALEGSEANNGLVLFVLLLFKERNKERKQKESKYNDDRA